MCIFHTHFTNTTHYIKAKVLRLYTLRQYVYTHNTHINNIILATLSPSLWTRWSVVESVCNCTINENTYINTLSSSEVFVVVLTTAAYAEKCFQIQCRDLYKLYIYNLCLLQSKVILCASSIELFKNKVNIYYGASS